MFWYFLNKVRLRRNVQFWTKIMGIFTQFQIDIFVVQKAFFFVKNIIKHHVQVFFKEIETQKNFKVFDENHGLTPFEKWTLSHYVSMTFLLCRKPFFTFRTLLSIMCHYFFKENQTEKKFHIFDQNPGLTLSEIWSLSHYVEMAFLYPRKPFFLFRTILNIMSRSFSKKMRLRRIFKFLIKIKG